MRRVKGFSDGTLSQMIFKSDKFPVAARLITPSGHRELLRLQVGNYFLCLVILPATKKISSHNFGLMYQHTCTVQLWCKGACLGRTEAPILFCMISAALYSEPKTNDYRVAT